MTELVVPTLDTLRQWLDDLGMSFFECDTCQALHLPHMQNFDGIYDAKLDLVDNTLLFSAMAEVRPSALLPLAADLSAINASSLTVKAFLDMQDDNLPKLVVCQSLSVGSCARAKSRYPWSFLKRARTRCCLPPKKTRKKAALRTIFFTDFNVKYGAYSAVAARAAAVYVLLFCI